MPKIMQLEQSFLTRLLIEFHPVPQGESRVNTEAKVDYDVLRNQVKPLEFRLDFRFHLDFESNGAKAGYEVDAAMQGFFAFPEGIPEDDMQKLIRINGCMILYGILRGHIGMITGAFPGAKLELPTLYMPGIVQNIEEEHFLEHAQGKRRTEKKLRQKRAKTVQARRVERNMANK